MFSATLARLSEPGNSFPRNKYAISGLATALIRHAVPLILLWLARPAPGHPPSGIAVDPAGRVFFTAGPMIVMVETNGSARTIVHDTRNERFHQLHHLQPGPAGGWLTASDLGNAIWQFTADGALTRFYPPSNQDRALSVGTGGDPFAVDPDGHVYAVNSVQGKFTQILRVTAAGEIRVVAGGDWGYADASGTGARFGDVHGGSLLVAPDGALLLTEDGRRVRRVDRDGAVTTVAGGTRRGHADGSGPAALFDGASGLALDGKENLHVAEQSGWIRRISRDRTVTTLAGTGRRGHRDGPRLEAVFDEPTGLALAGNGDLFVLEPHQPRVRRIADGQVTTIHTGLPSGKRAAPAGGSR